MKTAREWVRENVNEYELPTRMEMVIKMMTEYAKYYHQQQVKSVDLANVVGQSEQLPCDCSKHATYFDEEKKPRCKNCNQKSWLAR